MMGNIRIVMFKWHFILILLSFIFWKLESEYIYIHICVCMYVCISQSDHLLQGSTLHVCNVDFVLLVK